MLWFYYYYLHVHPCLSSKGTTYDLLYKKPHYIMMKPILPKTRLRFHVRDYTKSTMWQKKGHLRYHVRYNIQNSEYQQISKNVCTYINLYLTCGLDILTNVGSFEYQSHDNMNHTWVSCYTNAMSQPNFTN